MKSHRLVQYVTKTYGINEAEHLYDELNHRHFELGNKLNDEEMLAEAAMKIGVERRETLQFLKSNEGLGEIRAAQGVLRKMGISSIPTFIVDGKYCVSGALDGDSLARYFRDLLPELDQDGTSTSIFARVLKIPETVMKQDLIL